MAISIKRIAARQVEDFYDPIFNAQGGEIWTQNLSSSEAMGGLRDYMQTCGPWTLMVGWWNYHKPTQLLERAASWAGGSIKVFFVSNCHVKAWFLRDADGGIDYWYGTSNFMEPVQGNVMLLCRDDEQTRAVGECLATWPRYEYTSSMTVDHFAAMPACDGPVVRRPGVVISQGRFIPNYADDQRAQGNPRYQIIDPIRFELGKPVPPCPQQSSTIINLNIGR